MTSAVPARAARPTVAGRGGRPRGGAGRRTSRHKLFDAAVTLIAEQGFSATSVDEIAERAGVAKGTVYYNFTSKTDLFEELLRHGAGLLAASLQESADTVRAAGGTRVDALAAMMRSLLEFIVSAPSMTQLYVAELWRTNRSWQPTLMTIREQAVSVVEDTIREAVAAGEISDELDIPLTASAVFGMVLVTALDWQCYRPDRSIDEVHSALTLLVQGRISGGGLSGADANGGA